MKKKIKPGQLVTFENAIYKARKCLNPIQVCSKCDLYEKCTYEFKFKCGIYVYFERITRKRRARFTKERDT